MDILNDYLTFTSRVGSVHTIIRLLHLQGVKFEENKSYLGYEKCWYCNGVKIHFGWRPDYCVDISGIGCRFIETINNNKFDWNKLLTIIRKRINKQVPGLENVMMMSISRLDIALDEKEEITKMSTMMRYTKDHKYISKARRKIWTDGDEQQIVFGAPSSDTRLRIYNKAVERGVQGHWIRFEMQMRNESAESFLYNLKVHNEIGFTYSGVLFNYLRFVKQIPKNEHYDVPVCDWWRKLCNDAEKIKNYTTGGLDYNYSGFMSMAKKQIGGLAKTVVELHGGDATELFKMIEEAEMSKRCQRLVDDWREYRDKGNKEVVEGW